MPIRNLHEADFEQLFELYRQFYKKHNIFQGFSDEVTGYLRGLARAHKFLIYEEKDIVKGAVILEKRAETKEGAHKLWRLKHLGFESDAAGTKLVEDAEQRIKEASVTAKIEVYVAESETVLGFYKKLGYRQEAALENHYRWHEACFVLSKAFESKIY
jgi:ribosomal protein S18 acetylase RimI-like enzyme